MKVYVLRIANEVRITSIKPSFPGIRAYDQLDVSEEEGVEYFRAKMIVASFETMILSKFKV